MLIKSRTFTKNWLSKPTAFYVEGSYTSKFPGLLKLISIFDNRFQEFEGSSLFESWRSIVLC